MDRTNLYMSPVVKAALSAAAKRRGISLSELMRRALEEWVERNEPATMAAPGHGDPNA